MGKWYQVVKTIKGHKYLYAQQTYREEGRVRTRNRYLGRADGGGHTSQKSGEPGAVTTTPLFRDASDFGHALLDQFDAPKWAEDAGQQLLGQKGGQIASLRNLR